MRALAVLILAALLAGCAEPIPPERMAYVGDWRADHVRLLIARDGRVEYERRSGSSRTSIQAPLQRFEGDNFVVGIGIFNTTFVVSKPPREQDGQWKMTVDGVELVRRSGADELRARQGPAGGRGGESA